MSAPDHGVDPRDRGGLWPLVVAPTAWLLHFVACYVTAAIACEKATGFATPAGMRVALWAYTAVALAAIGVVAVRGRRRQHGGAPPRDAATAADRRRFLGLATFLLCVLSAIAVVYTALAFVVIGTCR